MLIQHDIQLSKLTIFGFVLAAIYAVYTLRNFLISVYSVKAPFAGFRSWLEPSLLVRLRFHRGARTQLAEGYKKFKNSMFKVCRLDTDLLIIPNKYVDELKSLPNNKLGATKPHCESMKGQYTLVNVLLETDLHIRLLRKLTRNLGDFTEVIKEELDFAIPNELPECEVNWKTLDFEPVLARIIARVSARIFVGYPTCRNETWLQATLNYPKDALIVAGVLRFFPSLLHPIIVWLLPPAWGIQDSHRRIARIISSVVAERRRIQRSSPQSYRKPDDLLQWFMDNPDPDQSQPLKLAQHQLVLCIGPIHSITVAALHVLYDLAARPKYFEPLRQEASNAIRGDGGWAKTTPNKLRRLDSFLKESQRVNPPNLVAFHRRAESHITLSDGAALPAGTSIWVAAECISHDTEIDDTWDVFDGFRYSRKRESADEADKHQFAMTDRNHLHFGHGIHACPGRFFASHLLKILIAELLIQYDFKYPPGKGRPKNLTFEEGILPDPAGRLMVRKRRAAA